jgi:hypothetical protein
MSLIISLTCALLATLLQQWARKYIRVTQPRFTPHKRAQVHAFFAEGVETLHLPWAVQVLPTLLHLSLFLFLSGVVVFLFNVNYTIFELVLPWTCICAVLYIFITFMPIFRPDSPYFTPLSSSAWFIVHGITYVVLRTFRWPMVFCNRNASGRLEELERRRCYSLSQGMQKIIDDTAQSTPLKVDGRVFMRTFDSLEKDDDLELFFNAVHRFRSSKAAADADPLLALTGSEKQRLFEELLGFMDRTLSSDLLAKETKNRRASLCTKAINPAEIRRGFRSILDKILSEDEYHGLKTVEFGHVVRDWGSIADKRTAAVAVQTIASAILVRARKRDDSWFALAAKQLDISEPVLRGFAVSDNSVSLANLVYMTRGLFSLLCEGKTLDLGSIALEAVSGFNIRETSLELQQDFCALWNEIVNRGNSLDAREILKYLRHVYVALHQGTDAAPTLFSETTHDLAWVLNESSSYPMCNLPDHHRDSTPHASPNPTTSNATQAGTETPTRTIPHSTPETSIPIPPLTSAFSASDIAPQHNADLRTSSDVPDFRSSPPVLVRESIPPDPPLSSEPSVTISDHVLVHGHSLPESHLSTLATTPGIPQSTTPPDPGAAEDGGGAEAILQKDEDALDPPPPPPPPWCITQTRRSDLPPQLLT